MSVSIKYKGSEIAALAATGTKTLNTAGKYCEGDIVVENEVAAVPTEAKTVELSMPSGSQTVSPSSGKFLSEVTIKKPATMLPENIKKGVNIGGVVGTLESGETLGNTTTLTAGLRGNAVPDAVIIAQQSSNIYKVYVGLADGTLIDTVVGGMVFIASPTTPLAIVDGYGFSVDYVTKDVGENFYEAPNPSTGKVVKITAPDGTIVIGLE